MPDDTPPLQTLTSRMQIVRVNLKELDIGVNKAVYITIPLKVEVVGCAPDTSAERRAFYKTLVGGGEGVGAASGSILKRDGTDQQPDERASKERKLENFTAEAGPPQEIVSSPEEATPAAATQAAEDAGEKGIQRNGPPLTTQPWLTTKFKKSMGKDPRAEHADDGVGAHGASLADQSADGGAVASDHGRTLALPDDHVQASQVPFDPDLTDSRPLFSDVVAGLGTNGNDDNGGFIIDVGEESQASQHESQAFR